MKNVSLIESSINSNKIWKIIDNQGKEFKSFNIFSKLLLKKYSENTRFSYSRSVAIFIDYLEESNIIYHDKQITKLFLVEIIESFPEWLIYGSNSGNLIAQTISETLKSKEYSSKSADLIMSAVRLFLKASERIRLEQLEIGYIESTPLFNEISQSEITTVNIKNKLIKNSMFSGVIANGPLLIKSCILPMVKSQNYFDKERAFPFDKIIPMIESLSSFRDKTLYMLCAASGCRIHEALQILIEDIDLKNRTINLTDPNSRISNKSYKSLSAEERNKLSWKGRQTVKTMLIQPFADLFFEYLEQYIKSEYTHHDRHEFVFQHIRGVRKGKPFFLSTPSTRNEAFKKATDIIGVSEELEQGIHSLRHMYATYLVNYFPKIDGSYGLPIAIVQKIMGHATISATQKYARHDQELIAVELEYANSLLYDGKSNMNLLEMKKKALEYQIKELENQYNAIESN